MSASASSKRSRPKGLPGTTSSLPTPPPAAEAPEAFGGNPEAVVAFDPESPSRGGIIESPQTSDSEPSADQPLEDLASPDTASSSTEVASGSSSDTAGDQFDPRELDESVASSPDTSGQDEPALDSRVSAAGFDDDGDTSTFGSTTIPSYLAPEVPTLPITSDGAGNAGMTNLRFDESSSDDEAGRATQPPWDWGDTGNDFNTPPAPSVPLPIDSDPKGKGPNKPDEFGVDTATGQYITPQDLDPEGFAQEGFSSEDERAGTGEGHWVTTDSGFGFTNRRWVPGPPVAATSGASTPPVPVRKMKRGSLDTMTSSKPPKARESRASAGNIPAGVPLPRVRISNPTPAPAPAPATPGMPPAGGFPPRPETEQERRDRQTRESRAIRKQNAPIVRFTPDPVVPLPPYDPVAIKTNPGIAPARPPPPPFAASNPTVVRREVLDIFASLSLMQLRELYDYFSAGGVSMYDTPLDVLVNDVVTRRTGIVALVGQWKAAGLTTQARRLEAIVRSN